MNTKTMEGLVGAKTNMNLLHTPFRVYKEARRKGDMATMERAMGYVNEFSDKAKEYKAEADKGMKEDAETAREKAKAEREKSIQRSKEEREKLEERIEKNRKDNKETDFVQVSEEGTLLLKEDTMSDCSDWDKIDLERAACTKAETGINKKFVVYTKTGDVSQLEQTASISISV